MSEAAAISLASQIPSLRSPFCRADGSWIALEISTIQSTGAELPPTKREIRANSSVKREVEFAAGRACARRALFTLGAPEFPILVGRAGEPLAPTPFAVTISHSQGIVVALASRDHIRSRLSIGIDVEFAGRVLPSFDPVIASFNEKECAIEVFGALLWRSAVFSAKESIYKATFSGCQRRLRFADVELKFTDAGSFEGEIVGETRRAGGLVRFAEGYVLTICADLA